MRAGAGSASLIEPRAAFMRYVGCKVMRSSCPYRRGILWRGMQPCCGRPSSGIRGAVLTHYSPCGGGDYDLVFDGEHGA